MELLPLRTTSYTPFYRHQTINIRKQTSKNLSEILYICQHISSIVIGRKKVLGDCSNIRPSELLTQKLNHSANPVASQICEYIWYQPCSHSQNAVNNLNKLIFQVDDIFISNDSINTQNYLKKDLHTLKSESATSTAE